MATGSKVEGSQLFASLDDLGKRIPVVKLERVEQLFPALQKITNKTVISPTVKTNEEKKKEGNNARKQLEERVKGKPDGCVGAMFPDNHSKQYQVDVLASSEPPTKQYKLEKETVRCSSPFSRASVIQEGKSTDKKITPQNPVTKCGGTTVDCVHNTSLAFSKSDVSAVDPLSSSRNVKLTTKSENYPENNVGRTYPQTYRKKSDPKGSPSTFWEINRLRTESMAFTGSDGTGINIPSYSENNITRIDTQIPGNIQPTLNEPNFSVTNTQISYSGSSDPILNQLSYSRNNSSELNPPTYSGINRPHINPHVYSGSNEPAMTSSLYSGSSITPSIYPGNNDPSVTPGFSVSSGHGLNSLSYTGYDRPGLTPVCSGNNVLRVNSQCFSVSSKPGLNPVYSENTGAGINSLTYSGNIRPIIITPVYYGTNGTGITPQTYSGTNAQSYSGNNISGISTLVYSGNSGSAISSISYKNSVGGSQSFPENSGVGLTSQTYAGNNESSSYPANTGLGMNLPTYSTNSGSAGNSAYSGNSAARINSSYSGNNSGLSSSVYPGGNGPGVNQACRDIRFSGDSSAFTANDMAQQYEVLQNYCQNGQTSVGNTTCQDGTWSSDYITLNSLPSNGYQLVDCSADYSYLFSCKVCGNLFSIADELIKHWRCHTGVDSLTCTTCYVSFTDVLFLQAHWKAIHMGGVCNDSGVVLRNSDKIIPQLVCEACGFAFSQLSTLEQHTLSTHVAVTHHRENMPWRSGNSGGTLYSVDNTQQTTTLSNKTLDAIPILSSHSLTKESTLLEDNVIGSDGEDHTLIELDNMDSNVTEHSTIKRSAILMNNVTETDVDGSDDGSIMEPEIEIATDSDKMADTSSSLSKEKLDSAPSHNGKLLKCKVCGNMSYNMTELLKHWRIHIGASSLTCTKCKKTFLDLPFLQAHWRRAHLHGNPVSPNVNKNHLLEKEDTFLCDTCGYAFPDFQDLEQHFIAMHVVAGFTQFPLRNRNSADNTQNVFSMHKQIVTTDRSRCSDVTTHKVQLMNNCKKKDTGKKQSEFKGSEEGKKAINKYSDSNVKRTKKPGGCLVCGETSDDMIKHLLTHTGVLSLECCLCGKDFVDVPFLQAHWRATHMNGEVRHTNNGIYVGNYKENVSCKEKLLCETCGCYVPQFSALEKHIILTHTVINPPYECKCDDVFPSEDELKTHISTCSW